MDTGYNALDAVGQRASGLNFKTREGSTGTLKPTPTLLACDKIDSAVRHDSATGATTGVARNAAITC